MFFFYHIWTGRPSFSVAQNHLNKLSIPFSTDVKSGENWSSSFREDDTILYMYIAQVQGQITPGDKILIVTKKL